MQLSNKALSDEPSWNQERFEKILKAKETIAEQFIKRNLPHGILSPTTQFELNTCTECASHEPSASETSNSGSSEDALALESTAETPSKETINLIKSGNPNTADFFNKLYSGTWEINDFKCEFVYEDSGKLDFYQRLARLDFFDCEGTILDVGCGMGGVFSVLADDTRLKKYGVDHSEKAIEIIKSRVCGEFLVGDVNNLPFENNFFDRLICIETLEHVDKPDALVTEMLRVLKPRGKILITVPNEEDDVAPGDWPGGVNLHVNQFSPASLSQLVVKCQFKIDFCDIVDGVIQLQAQKAEPRSSEILIGSVSEDISTLLQEFNNFKPQMFMIESTLACNLRCPECAIGGKLITRKQEMLSFDRFKILADKIRPYANFLYPYIWGEPTLNPDIIPILRYASSFTTTNISTNGMTMTDSLAEDLITSGVSSIIVSIDGYSQDVYGKYRIGGDVNKAFTALATLQLFNLKHGRRVDLSPQFVVFRHNQHEIEAFTQCCRSIGLEPAFKSPYLREDSVFEYSDLPEYIRSHYPTDKELKNAMRDCPDARYTFTVLVDGSVVACCYDHDKMAVFGNLFEQEVDEIWNSPCYRQFRWDMLNGDAPAFCTENCLSYYKGSPERHRCKT